MTVSTQLASAGCTMIDGDDESRRRVVLVRSWDEGEATMIRQLLAAGRNVITVVGYMDSNAHGDARSRRDSRVCDVELGIETPLDLPGILPARGSGGRSAPFAFE